MRFVVYFCCLLSQSYDSAAHQVGGTVNWNDSTVQAYVYPYEYVEFSLSRASTWNIETIELPDGSTFKQVSAAVLYLKHPNGSGLITINRSTIIFYYHFEKDDMRLSDYIYMERKMITPYDRYHHCKCDVKWDRPITN